VPCCYPILAPVLALFVIPWVGCRRSEPGPAALVAARAGLSPLLAQAGATVGPRQLALDFRPDGGGGPGAFALPGMPLLPLLPQLGVCGFAAFPGFACCVLAFDQQLSLPGPVGWAGFCWPGTVGLVVPGRARRAGGVRAVLFVAATWSGIPEAPLLAVALSYPLLVTLADVLAALRPCSMTPWCHR